MKYLRIASIFILLVLACPVRVFFPIGEENQNFQSKSKFKITGSACFSNNAPLLIFYVLGSFHIPWNYVFTVGVQLQPVPIF